MFISSFCSKPLIWLPVSFPSLLVPCTFSFISLFIAFTSSSIFFFNSLVVGLPYSLVFWQFWLFVVFKFVVLLLVVRGGKVCLPMPPSWLEVCKGTFIKTHFHKEHCLDRILAIFRKVEIWMDIYRVCRDRSMLLWFTVRNWHQVKLMTHQQGL